MPGLSEILTDNELLQLQSMKELEQYREAVAPLRVADIGLCREAMGMVAEMSPTMGLIRQTVENLLEIFDPHESIYPQPDRVPAKKAEFDFIVNPKRLVFVCKDCGHTVFAYKQKRKCPKCGGRLKQHAH